MTPGELAAQRALAAQWLALPGNEGLTFHAVSDWGCWYAKRLPSGLDSHGLIPWADLSRALRLAGVHAETATGPSRRTGPATPTREGAR